MAPNVTQSKVEEMALGQMNDTSIGGNENSIHPGAADSKEQRKRRKKKKNKSKGQGQGSDGPEDDSREITLNETMSSMGTNGDDAALDLKDPDSLSKSKARRVRRKRLKERNINCDEGGMNESRSSKALEKVATENNGTGFKLKSVESEPPEPLGLSAPANTNRTVDALEPNTVIVSDDQDELVERDIQAAPMKDVDSVFAILEDASRLPNQPVQIPVENPTLDHKFVESTSIQSDVDRNRDISDEQEPPIENSVKNAQTNEVVAPSPAVYDDSSHAMEASSVEKTEQLLEEQPAPTIPESQNPTADEGLGSSDNNVSGQPLLETPEMSNHFSDNATKYMSVEQTKVEDTPSHPIHPIHEDETTAVTEEANDVQPRVPSTTEETVEQPMTEDREPTAKSSESPSQSDSPAELFDQAAQPQLVLYDDQVTQNDEVPLMASSPLKSEPMPMNAPTAVVGSSADGAEVSARKTRGSLVYADEEVKAEKEDSGCAACSIM